jgi:hypothetical protein
MARTIDKIQEQIITEKDRSLGLESLNSTSNTAIWRVWTYITAVAIWTLENLFDLHKKEVDRLLLTKKPHNLLWYKTKAEAFQFGSELKPGSDCYDNTGVDHVKVAKSRIVKHVAVVENKKTGWVRIKAAKEVNGELQKLSNENPDELGALNSYMQHIKDAGVKLIVQSLPPDRLKMHIDIYYDAMVLDENGGRLDGGSVKPVNDPIDAYLRSLPFNGAFVLATLTDQLQETPGVVIPQIRHVAVSYGTRKEVCIPVRYVPDGGYLRIYEADDLKITYYPSNKLPLEGEGEVCTHDTYQS